MRVEADFGLSARLLLGAVAFLLALAMGVAATPAQAIPELPDCRDNVDNDGDGRTDYPWDPGCASPDDNSEANSSVDDCSDGLDNDHDGRIDFPNDPGCEDAADRAERKSGPRECSDGVDNDGDTKADYPADPGCGSAYEDDELDRECSDDLDNEGDGRTDWPADFGCTSENDATEIDPPQCNDGRDNDGDGTIDYGTDSDCVDASDAREGPDPACSDGRDNDGDGRADFPADPGCSFSGDGDETDTVIVSLPTGPSAAQSGSGAQATTSARMLSPFPVVRLRGQLDRRGVRVTLLSVRAPSLSKVAVYCTGRSCPRRRVAVDVGRRLVRVRQFEKRLRGGTILKVYVTRTGYIGKYTRFRFFSKRVPSRLDRCATKPGTKPRLCPSS